MCDVENCVQEYTGYNRTMSEVNSSEGNLCVIDLVVDVKLLSADMK